MSTVLSPTNLIEHEADDGTDWADNENDNITLLNGTLLKVSGMIDSNLSGLANGDTLSYDSGDEEFDNVPMP